MIIDRRCSKQENFTIILYDEENPLEIDVEIKYCREEILCVIEMLERKFRCHAIVTSINTDEIE